MYVLEMEPTGRFTVGTVVLQVDFLSHFLFNIVLDYVMSKLINIDNGIE